MSALHVDAVTLADELETGLALRLSLITRWKKNDGGFMGDHWWGLIWEKSRRKNQQAWQLDWTLLCPAVLLATFYTSHCCSYKICAEVAWEQPQSSTHPLGLLLWYTWEPALYPCAHSPDVRELRLHRANMTTKDEMGGKGSPLPFLRQQNSRESSTILRDPGRPEPWFPWEQPVWGHALLLACPPSVFSLQSLILALGITIQVLRPFAQALASGSFSGFLLSWRLAEYGLVVRDRKQAEMTPEFLVLWLNRCEDHSLIREYRRRWSVWVS